MIYNTPLQSVKKEDAFLAYYFAAPVANLFARLSLKSKFITPNVYTSLSFIFAIATAILFFQGQYKFFLIGCVTLFFTLVFDCADGQTARLKNLKSEFGHWFDYHSDKVKDIMILLCLAYGAYAAAWDEKVLIFAFLAIACQFLRNITRLNRIVFDLKNNTAPHEETIIKKDTSQFIRVLKHSTLFKEADRYLLFIIFCALNQVALLVMVYFVIELFFAISSAYLNYKKFSIYDKKHV